MENKGRENIIYFKDLLFVVLYQWKKLLAVALVLACALGGYTLITGWQDINDPEAMENHKQQNAILTGQFEDEVNALDAQIATLQKEIASQQIYLDNSILMNLDPYAYYEASVNFYVQTDYQILPGMEYQNPNKTETIIQAYTTLLIGEDSLQKIADTTGIEPQYLPEIINFDNSASDLFTITIYSPTRQQAEQMLALVTEQIESAHSSIEQTVAAHTISVIAQTVLQQTNKTLVDAQQNEVTRLSTLDTSLADAQAQRLALNPPQTEATTMAAVVKSAVKYAVVGDILGVFLVVLIAWVLHLTGGKVYSARTLTNRTCVKVLGCLNARPVKNRIDRWLRKQEGRCGNDMQLQLDLIAANVSNRCGDIHALLLTGSTEIPEQGALEEALRKRLPNVRLICCGSILSSAEALDALCGCDCVLLAEQCRVSRYETIIQLADTVADYGKDLLGCVLYGG